MSSVHMLIVGEVVFLVSILVFMMLYVSTHHEDNSAKEKAKSENAIMSWALGAFTNLAIGIILLLVEYYVIT